MKKKQSTKSCVKNIFLILFASIWLFPILWIIVMSLKTTNEIFTSPFALPQQAQWNNYVYAFNRMHFPKLLRNTMVVAIASLSVTMLMSLFASFAIARMNFGERKLQNLFYAFFISGIIVPAFILLFPVFLINSKMGINNNLLGVILPYVGWLAPMSILVMVGSFKSIPVSIEEAAAIDGCGVFRILFEVDIPIMKATIATTLIINFLGIWNEFPLSSITLTNPNVQTISLAASQFMGQYTSNYAPMAAALAILTVPQIIVFSSLQKYVVGNIAAGSIKG